MPFSDPERDLSDFRESIDQFDTAISPYVSVWFHNRITRVSLS